MGRGPGWERQRWREERGGRTDTPSALGLVSLSTFCPGRWAPGEETEAEGRRADPCASWAQRFSRERVRDPGMTLGLWRGLWLSLLTPLCFASPLSGQLAYSEPILESQPFPLLIDLLFILASDWKSFISQSLPTKCFLFLKHKISTCDKLITLYFSCLVPICLSFCPSTFSYVYSITTCYASEETEKH